jgi:hypothetical protein
MKNMIWVAALILAVLFASCENINDGFDSNPDNGTIKPLPDGVYIAGYYYKGSKQQACYWTDNKRINLDGCDTASILISDGHVLVTGRNNKGESCYWVDGIRYDSDFRQVVINGGKIYKLTKQGKVFIDGIEWSMTVNYNYNFNTIVAAEGNVYAAGIIYQDYAVYFKNSGYNLICNNTSEFSFIPVAITVTENGTVYIAGYDDSSSKYWYYANGNFIEIEELTGYKSIKKLMVSDGDIYVFQDMNIDWDYWVTCPRKRYQHKR